MRKDAGQIWWIWDKIIIVFSARSGFTRKCPQSDSITRTHPRKSYLWKIQILLWFFQIYQNIPKNATFSTKSQKRLFSRNGLWSISPPTSIFGKIRGNLINKAEKPPWDFLGFILWPIGAEKSRRKAPKCPCAKKSAVPKICSRKSLFNSYI